MKHLFSKKIKRDVQGYTDCGMVCLNSCAASASHHAHRVPHYVQVIAKAFVEIGLILYER